MDAAEAKKCLKLICKTFGLEVKTSMTWFEISEDFVGFTVPKLKPMRKPDIFTIWLRVKDYPQSLIDEAHAYDLFINGFIYANETLLDMIHGEGYSFNQALSVFCEELQCKQLYYDDPDKVRAYLQKHTNESFIWEKARTKIGEVPAFSSYEELKMKLTLRGDMR